MIIKNPLPPILTVFLGFLFHQVPGISSKTVAATFPIPINRKFLSRKIILQSWWMLKV